jgi:hypothetical protein
MKKQTPSESSANRVIASKKPVANNKVAYIERTCKILDALIMEVMPAEEPTIRQSLFITFKDIYDGSVITLDVTREDLSNIDINLTSRELIDICGWFKSYQGVFTIVMPDDTSVATIEMFYNQKDLLMQQARAEEPIEEPIDLLADSQQSTTVKAKNKFGRK